MSIKLILPVALCGLLSFSASLSVEPKQPSAEFNKFWYQGKAEVSSFDLQQWRNGEMRPGDLVLTFYPEDFSLFKHTKTDDPKDPEDLVKVLRMTKMVSFNTGINATSIMQSVFTPLNGTHTIRSVASLQDWIGQEFTAIDLVKGHYEVDSYSYFEGEGNLQVKMPVLLLEDELPNMIRINPDSLPSGEVEIMPNSIYCNLARKPHEPVKATTTVSEDPKDKNLKIYTINYPGFDRLVKITFEKKFPHQITKMEDAFPDTDGKKQTTVATLKNTDMLDYSRHNKQSDLYLRDSLGLRF